MPGLVANQLIHAVAVLNIPPDLLQPRDIELRLEELGLHEHDLIYNIETSSTNIDVLQHYQASGRLSIAVCEKQTAGRGRRGRQWLSPHAQNIYCTIGLNLPVKAEQLGLLSIASGIALCRVIVEAGFDAVKLKWPNDLVFDDGLQKYKLGGILIASRPAGDGYFVAIGFGLNVHMTRIQLDAIAQPATSLDLISGRNIQRQSVLLAAISSVVDQFRLFSESSIDMLLGEFSRYDAYRNQQVCVLNGEDKITGLCTGIGRDGQLLVKTDQTMLTFSAAEISLRAG